MNSEIGILLLNSDGNIIEANQEACEILNLERNIILTRNHKGPEWKVINSEYREMDNDEYATTLAIEKKQEINNVEMGIVIDNDNIHWIRVNAMPILSPSGQLQNVVCSFVVINTQDSLTQRLLNLHNNFSELAKTLNLHLIRTDSNNRINFIDNCLAEKLGYSSGDLLGKNIYNTVLKKQNISTQNGSKTRSQGNNYLSFTNKNNSHIYMKTEINPIFNESVELEGHLYIISENFTQNSLYKDLIKNLKIDSQNQFCSDLAHALKNPLANISSLSQYCLSMPKQDSFNKESFQAIWNCTKKASKIISHIQLLLKHPEINHLVSSVSKQLVRRAEITLMKFNDSQITINNHIPSSLPAIEYDPEYMKIVFDCIIENAMQAMGEQGELNLSIKEENDEIKISIKDNGKGIAKEKITKIFKPFQSFSGEGVGLGLPLAQKIIEAHHGSLEITSKPNIGTTVVITLPQKGE